MGTFRILYQRSPTLDWSHLLEAHKRGFRGHVLVRLGAWRARLVGEGHQGFADLLQGLVVGVLGVAAAPLRPQVLWVHFPSAAEVQFRGIRRLGQVAEAIAYFLQHLLAVAAAVAGGKRFGSHLPVSVGFLASLHVKACMGHNEGDEEDANRSRVAPMESRNLRYFSGPHTANRNR